MVVAGQAVLTVSEIIENSDGVVLSKEFSDKDGANVACSPGHENFFQLFARPSSSVETSRAAWQSRVATLKAMERESQHTAFSAYLSSGVSLLRDFGRNVNLMENVERAVQIVGETLRLGKPVLVAGNGGSASDALHISGELVGKFYVERSAQNVICLNSKVTVLTAWSNDVSFETVFERQVEAHGVAGGLLWGLSTSGNSINLVRAFQIARSIGMSTLAMTGAGGGVLGKHADLLIDVPSEDTPRIQEAHILAYHYICREVERNLS